MSTARPLLAAALAALVVGSPFAYGGPSIIRDEMLQDTAITPALGRGYSIATNTYQSMCLIDVVSTTPSYDYDYTFENIQSGTSNSGGIATSNSTAGASTRAQTTQRQSGRLDGYQLSDEWTTKVTEKTGKSESTYQHMLATISINVYYNSVDESKSKLSPAATKILENKDIPGFFDSCGMYYVRSISRRARIYSLITYTTTTGARDLTLDVKIKSAIRSFSLTAGQKAPTTTTDAPAAVTTPIPGGAEMIKGMEYWSPNGQYRTVFQTDGNLCVYQGAGMADCKGAFARNNASAVIEADGHCYGRFDTRMNQFGAATACKGYGASLVAVTDAIENARVAALGGAMTPWIGGNDITTEGSFEWATGEPFTYKNWGPNEPNGGRTENCLHVNGAGAWNDIPCGTALPYICEGVPATAIWCSMTAGRGDTAWVQNNDVVIKDKGGFPVWQTSKDHVGTDGGTKLVMQDDGNLVLLSASNQELAVSRAGGVMIGRPTGDAPVATTTVTTGPSSTGFDQSGTETTTTTGTNIQISTKAVGLGKQLGTMLVSYDIVSYKAAIESAFKATLPDNVGKVSAIEVVPWIENTEFQSLFKLEEVTVPVFDALGFPVMDLTDPLKPVPKTKRVLPYEQKRILQTNAEFLAEIDRAARAKLNIFYKAKMCRAQIDADYMEQDEKTGVMYFPVDRSAVGNAIQILKASYGANCNPKNVDNMTSRLAQVCDGETSCNYLVDPRTLGDPAPGCQKAYEVEYRCMAPATRGIRQLALAKEAGGKSVAIDCVDPTTPAKDRKRRPTIGQTTYVFNNRKPDESVLLEDVVAMLSEPKLQRLWMEYDSFMYGGTGDDATALEKDPTERAAVARAILMGQKPELGYPKNLFPGAGRCIGELFSAGISARSYRTVSHCQRIEETFATIAGQKIDDFCMPRFTRTPGLDSVEASIDAATTGGDAFDRTPTAP